MKWSFWGKKLPQVPTPEEVPELGVEVTAVGPELDKILRVANDLLSRKGELDFKAQMNGFDNIQQGILAVGKKMDAMKTVINIANQQAQTVTQLSKQGAEWAVEIGKATKFFATYSQKASDFRNALAAYAKAYQTEVQKLRALTAEEAKLIAKGSGFTTPERKRFESIVRMREARIRRIGDILTFWSNADRLMKGLMVDFNNFSKKANNVNELQQKLRRMVEGDKGLIKNLDLFNAHIRGFPEAFTKAFGGSIDEFKKEEKGGMGRWHRKTTAKFAGLVQELNGIQSSMNITSTTIDKTIKGINKVLDQQNRQLAKEKAFLKAIGR